MMPQLRKLLNPAPRQIGKARRIAIAHFNAIHAASLMVERPELVVYEAMVVVMLDGEPKSLDRREHFETRNYAAYYSAG
jgi:hypothetical protein